ncbi:MAG: hypothetical protein JNN27_17135 [Planctomycetes bacterium]|nr:hypothetical protein [Planctomycetota bacterium]
MSEISFFATDDDLDVLWELIRSELRMSAYPDPWFGELPVPALNSAFEVAAHLCTHPAVAPALSYHLISPDWSTEPLDYWRCENNPNFAAYWTVSHRYGGPSIHFHPRFGYPNRDASRTHAPSILAGRFWDYPTHHSIVDRGAVIHRPGGLSRAMSSIRRKLRSLGTPVRASTGRRATALSGAIAAHDAGAALAKGDLRYARVALRRRPHPGV